MAPTKNHQTMRIIETKVYLFEELNEEQQEKAIEVVRKHYYKHMGPYFDMWAVDSDCLFDPLGPELKAAGLPDNTRLFDHNPNRTYFGDNPLYLHAEGLEVCDWDAFQKYFGIPNEYDIRIGSTGGLYPDTVLELEWKGDDEPTWEQEEAADNAMKKFANHMRAVLNRILADIEYRYTDDAIREDIDANKWEFTIDDYGNVERF